eukprot:254837_1
MKKNNDIIFPIALSDDENCYLRLIQSMNYYSQRCYLFEQMNANDIPFPIVFILNLLTRFPDYLVSDNPRGPLFTSTTFKRYLGKYVQNYFLENYNPNNIPLLYSIILDFIANNLQKLGFNPNYDFFEGIKYHNLSIKYYTKHCNIVKHNHLTHCLVKRLKLSNLSMFEGHTLNQMTACSVNITLHVSMKTLPSHVNKTDCETNAIFAINKSFQFFVVNHQNYSIYDRDGDDSCMAGFVFVCEMTRRMVRAYSKNVRLKYQKRYKRLLIIALKSWKHFLSPDAERYGLYHVYLGYYYATFSDRKNMINNLKRSRELLYEGIRIIRRGSIYQACLSEVYIFMIWVERALGNTDGVITVYKMSIEFNEHHNLIAELEENKKELKQFKKEKKMLPKISVFMKQKYAESCWNHHFGRRRRSQKGYGSWFYYFKHNKWYQVMKNICFMKECNYSKCRTKSVKLSKCKKCKSVYYCCRDHQKIDWKIKHRTECQVLDRRDASFTLKSLQHRWQINDMNLPTYSQHIRFIDTLSSRHI